MKVMTADGVEVQEGDWIFNEFQLKLIKKTKNDNITGVSCGWFSLGGSHLNNESVSLSLKHARVSSVFKQYSDDVHALNCNSLNHPDINRKLIELWVSACLAKDGDVQECCDAGKAFYNSIKDSTQGLRKEYADGVRIFGR